LPKRWSFAEAARAIRAVAGGTFAGKQFGSRLTRTILTFQRIADRRRSRGHPIY